MKYIKKFYESDSSKPRFEDVDIGNYFAHSFDLCSNYKTYPIYFDPNNLENWAANDFSNPNSKYHPIKCDKGVCIEFEYKFSSNEYNKVSIEKFGKWIEFITEIENDTKRFMSTFSYKKLFLEVDSTIISIMIV